MLLRRPLVIAMAAALFACTSAAPSQSSDAATPPVAGEYAPALSMTVAKSVTLLTGRTTSIRVEVPNRDALDSVLVIEAPSAPEGVIVEMATIGIREKSIDVVVNVDPTAPLVDGARLALTLTSTRGTESTADIAADVVGSPGSIDSLETYPPRTFDEARQIAAAKNGSLAVLGMAQGYAAVMRTLANGKVDKSISNDGFIEVNADRAGSMFQYPSYLTFTPDGGFVVGGWIYDVDDMRFTGESFVKRFSSVGEEDPAFAFAVSGRGNITGMVTDDAGRVVLAFRQKDDPTLYLHAVDGLGNVTASGTLPNLAGPLVGMSRDDADGLRLAFESGEVLRLGKDFSILASAAMTGVEGLAVDANGRVLFLREGRIERWSSAVDRIDETFAVAGIPGATWKSIAVASDGRIAALGVTDKEEVLIARFRP